MRTPRLRTDECRDYPSQNTGGAHHWMMAAGSMMTVLVLLLPHVSPRDRTRCSRGSSGIGIANLGEQAVAVAWIGAKQAPTRERLWPYSSLSDIFSRSSNVPRRNSSPVELSSAVSPNEVIVCSKVNAAFGYAFHTARSSAAIVSQPNVNMYRPGSATRPTWGHVILLTGNPFLLRFSLVF